MSNADRQEEELYAEAAAELDGGNRNEGLWAKCFAECDGDENKAKALYLKAQVGRLKEDRRGKKEKISKQNRQFEARQGRAKMERQAGTGTVAESQKQYTYVGGWLLVFCITLILCRPLVTWSGIQDQPMSHEDIIEDVKNEFQQISGKSINDKKAEQMAREVWGEVNSDPVFKELTNFFKWEIAAGVLIIILSFTSGVALLMRMSWAVRFTKFYLQANFCWVVVDSAVFLSKNGEALKSLAGMDIHALALKQIISVTVYTGIWYTYLLKSKRVAGTFELKGREKKKPRRQEAQSLGAGFYYVKDGDEEFGPLTKREIQSQAHKFSADALYKRDGTDDWYDLRKLLG